MPNTKLYIVYAAAGVFTLTGGVNAVPTRGTPELDLGLHGIVQDAYKANTPGKTAYGTTAFEKERAYPKKGETLVINTKIKLNKNKPPLQKEKYNFEIYEG